MAVGSFPRDRDILKNHVLDNLSNADNAEVLNGPHLIRILFKRSGTKRFRELQWTDEQRGKIRGVIDLIKSPGEREIAYAIMISENSDGTRSFLKQAIDLANEEPLAFLYALNSQKAAILNMPGDSQSKVRELLARLDPVERGKFQDIFLVNETTRAEYLLQQAIDHRSFEASNILQHIAWKIVLSHNSPKVNELILRMLSSKEAHLRYPRKSLLQQFLNFPGKRA